MPSSGDPVFASDFDSVTPKFIQKQTAETVNNSITLQDDDDFFVTLGVGTYRIQSFLHVSCTSNSADIRTAWTFSGTVVSTGRSVMAAATASTDGAGTNMRWSGHGFGTSITSGVSTTVASIVQEDLIFTVTVQGTLQLQWAQGTATVVDTTCSTASRMYITQLTAA